MLDFNQIYQNALDNVVWLAAWVVGPLVLIGIVWLLLPLLLRKLFRWLDAAFSGDFMVLEHSVSRLTLVVVSLVVLVVSGAVVVSGLGGEITVAQDAAIGAATVLGVWLLNQGVKLVLIIVVGLVMQRLVSHAIPRIVEFQVRSRAGDQLEGEIQKNILTLSGVLTKAGGFGILSVTFFMVMGQVGINLAPLLVAAGVVGIAIGFGAQNLVRDVLAGIFIILENQYRIGDVVNIAGIGGLVEDINLRRTVLRDLDYRQHFIPNGEIRTATNYTKDKSRVNINIGVAYKEDLEHVIQVLNRVGDELAQDPEWGPLILDPIKVLRVDNFGDSAIEIKVLGETVPIRQWDIAGQYRLRVKKAFDELGIEIPFPHRTLYWGTGEPNVMAMRSAVTQAQEDGAARQRPSETGVDQDAVPTSPNPDPDDG